MRSRGGGGGDEGRGEEERNKAQRQGLMQFVGHIQVFWFDPQIDVILRGFQLCHSDLSLRGAAVWRDVPCRIQCPAGFRWAGSLASLQLGR